MYKYDGLNVNVAVNDADYYGIHELPRNGR